MTPRTEAGRSLVKYSEGLPSMFITPTWIDGILAIEQEAAEAERARIAPTLREIAEAYHQTDNIRDHADPNDNTGWNVKGIETCADPLCVEALALLDPHSEETP